MAKWTQADLDKLDAAIADGAAIQSMTFGDQTYTFRSLEELLKLRSLMQQEVSGSKSKRRLATTRKGV